MKVTNLEQAINQFSNDNHHESRYASFDYCYNYFYQQKNLKEDIEKSCLVLGFYLASWGMLRGSSFLLQKSVKYLEPAINCISELDKKIWEIDVDSYNEININKIIDIYNVLKNVVIKDGKNAEIILISKIMLGVFGFVPAIDTYFQIWHKNHFNKVKFNYNRLNQDLLKSFKVFYDANKNEIDYESSKIKTISFETSKPTNISYSKAKIIDMYGFESGKNFNNTIIKN